MKHHFKTIAFCLIICAAWTASPCSLNFNSLPPIGTLPPFHKLAACDMQTLSYRLYGADTKNLIILLHGSGYHGSYLDSLATKLSTDATVCVPNIRGHYQSGSCRGNCSYIGQLEDDICNLLNHLNYTSYKTITIIGHSSGGGLALRFAGGKHGTLIHKYVLLSPIIPICNDLMRTDTGWSIARNIRIGVLTIANLFGITWFNNANVINFNMPSSWRDGTETLTYNYNLLCSMHPRYDYEKDIESLNDRAIVIVGKHDECVWPEIYATLFKKSPIHILEDVDHFGLVGNMKAVGIIKAFI